MPSLYEPFCLLHYLAILCAGLSLRMYGAANNKFGWWRADAVDPGQGLVTWLPALPAEVTTKPQRRDASDELADSPMLASRARGWMSATASKPVVPGGLPLDVRVGSLCKFDDPGLPGVMHATASLRAVSCGTELSIEQDGIPEAIPLGVLSRLAGLAHVASETGRSRNPRVARPPAGVASRLHAEATRGIADRSRAVTMALPREAGRAPTSVRPRSRSSCRWP